MTTELRTIPHAAKTYTSTDAANDAALHADIRVNRHGGLVHLGQDQHLRVRDAQGWRVQAINGTVWITQEGDSRDIVLRHGQSFVLDRNGTALLSALDDADLALQAA